MPKTAKTAKTNGSTETPVLRDVLMYYSTAGVGDSVVEAFAHAHGAVALGHRTYSNVPFDRIYREGDQMSVAQAAFLSAAVIRSSLGVEDYASIDEAAAVTIRDIPAQYSLLEDAVDSFVQKMRAKNGLPAERRQDRHSHVLEVMGMGSEVFPLISREIKALINERKTPKGEKAASATTGVSMADLVAAIEAE